MIRKILAILFPYIAILYVIDSIQYTKKHEDFKKTIYELEMLVVLVFVGPMRMGMDVLMDMNFFVKVNRAIFHGINGIRDVG
jgi:hypothetical protein